MESSSPNARRGDRERLYRALDALRERTGGYRRLGDASPKGWPSHGVYFFFDEAEPRASSVAGMRCVRVGTHALSPESKSTLWKRLRRHRGDSSGGGAHRTSIFRRLVGNALIARDRVTVPSWCGARPAPGAERDGEQAHERRVSEVIRALPLLALPVADTGQRDRIERGVIALLSDAHATASIDHLGDPPSDPPFDSPSDAWLGRWSPSVRVRSSGLWNQNYVLDAYPAAILDELELIVQASGKGPAP